MTLKTFVIQPNDFTLAGSVSSAIKRHAKERGYSQELVRRIAIACYEAEINMVIHSFGGQITLCEENEQLTVTFEDKGPGIPDIDLALKAGWSSASPQAQAMGFGAGLGLPNIKKNVDSFHLESNHSGTKLIIGFSLKGESHDPQ